jgi:hypothetical protein
MAMKEQPRTTYRSMQGREIDMNKLINLNETTPAVGNMKVNARGDELGAGGKIVRKREEIMAAGNPQAPVPDQINIRAVTPAPVVAPAPAPVAPVVVKDVAGMDPEGKE